MFKIILFLVVIFSSGWAKVEKEYELLTLEDVQNLAKTLVRWGFEDLQISNDCKRDLKEFFRGLKNLEPWAVAIFDSIEKFPSGLLKGRKIILGQFDECIAVIHPNFKGQHCMVEVSLESHSNSTLQWIDFGLTRMATKQFSYGICVPSTCDSKDLKATFSAIGISKYFNLEINQTSCTTGEFPKLRTKDYATIAFFSVIIALAVASTAYDLYLKYIGRTERRNEILVSFSIYTNSQKIFRIDDSSSALNALYGIRFLSMCWIILGHFFSTVTKGNVINPIDLIELSFTKDWILGVNGYPAVDTFFFMGGLLACISFFRDIANKKSYDAPVALIKRYFRLTPLFAIVLLFYVNLLSRLGNGPIWANELNSLEEHCHRDWWTYLLYMGNYLRPETKCFAISWYLAADMQMYFITPFILYFILFRPKQAPAFLLTLTFGSSLLSFIKSYDNDLPASVAIRRIYENETASLEEYAHFHTRMSPWLIGIATGSLICGIRANKINFRPTKVWLLVGWSLSAVLCLASFLGIIAFLPFGSHHSAFRKSCYRAFHRGGWALGLSWIVIACVTGYGGPVNHFLSSKTFQPLAKLSYGLFMIHKPVQIYRISNAKNLMYADNINTMYTYFGDLCISLILSIPVVLLFELPFINLEKRFLSNLKIFPYPKNKSFINENIITKESPHVLRNEENYTPEKKQFG